MQDMDTEQTKPWHNWSSSVQARPQQIVKPGSINELAQLVAEYGCDGRHVRVVGSGHSFTPLVQTNDVLMSLDNLQGIEAVDAEHNIVTVRGGTKLHYLGEALLAHGLAQENL